MLISDPLQQGINRAINEADLLGVSVASDASDGEVRLRVLTLPSSGPEPEDRIRTLVCRPVHRVVASLRLGAWNDRHSTAIPLTLLQLSEVVGSSVSQLYGGEFLDPPEVSWDHWRGRLSLDLAFEGEGEHVIEVFKNNLIDPERHLDIRIWFDDLEVRDGGGGLVNLDEFAAGGTRWWEAFYAGDPRTQGHGMAPLRVDKQQPPERR